MKVKNGSGVLHDYVKELLDSTKKIARSVADKTHETVDYNEIIEYATSLGELHTTLSESFDPSEGRARVIERFLNQWNNLMLGVFYISDIVHKEKKLTKRQYDIFVEALQEIIQYGKKHHPH